MDKTTRAIKQYHGGLMEPIDTIACIAREVIAGSDKAPVSNQQVRALVDAAERLQQTDAGAGFGLPLVVSGADIEQAIVDDFEKNVVTCIQGAIVLSAAFDDPTGSAEPLEADTATVVDALLPAVEEAVHAYSAIDALDPLKFRMSSLDRVFSKALIGASASLDQLPDARSDETQNPSSLGVIDSQTRTGFMNASAQVYTQVMERMVQTIIRIEQPERKSAEVAKALFGADADDFNTQTSRPGFMAGVLDAMTNKSGTHPLDEIMLEQDWKPFQKTVSQVALSWLAHGENTPSNNDIDGLRWMAETSHGLGVGALPFVHPIGTAPGLRPGESVPASLAFSNPLFDAVALRDERCVDTRSLTEDLAVAVEQGVMRGQIVTPYTAYADVAQDVMARDVANGQGDRAARAVDRLLASPQAKDDAQMGVRGLTRTICDVLRHKRVEYAMTGDNRHDAAARNVETAAPGF